MGVVEHPSLVLTPSPQWIPHIRPPHRRNTSGGRGGSSRGQRLAAQRGRKVARGRGTNVHSMDAEGHWIKWRLHRRIARVMAFPRFIPKCNKILISFLLKRRPYFSIYPFKDLSQHLRSRVSLSCNIPRWMAFVCVKLLNWLLSPNVDV